MELRKKFLSVAALAFAAALSTGIAISASAEGEQALNGFEITHTSVRLVVGTKEDPSGLRFKTVTPAGESAYVEAYTNITFTSNVVTNKNPNGDAVNYSAKVPTSSWTEDGWNTVLLEIPSTDYGTQITAQSYVKVSDTEVYVTEAKTTSIAKTASLVMQKNNESNAALEAYVAGAVESITLNETSGSLLSGESVQLTATTAPAGFGVLWTSSDPSIATVDATGKVTAVGAGQATITASMGGKTAVYTVNCTMPYSVDFENGKNVVVVDGEKTTVSGVVEIANGNHGVAVQSSGFETDVALSAAWLANAFDNGAADISFKLYTSLDGYATYNGYNGGKGGLTNGQLMYRKADGSYSCKNPEYPDNADLACYNGVSITPKANGYIGVTITKVNYEEWKTNATLAGVPNSPMVIQLRLGVNENRDDVTGFGYGVQQPGTVYVDDLKANILVKYDPVNNDPLAQDGTFENGVNALVTNAGDITYKGVEERVAGNYAVKMNMADNKFDIYLGLNRTWLANAFDTNGADSVSFKVYTDSDGWCEKHRWGGGYVRNGDLNYYNGSDIEKIQQDAISKTKKVDGYIPVTVTKAHWETFKNGDTTGVSDLYIYMVLGVANNGVQANLANDVLIHDTSVGDIYIDDLTANIPPKHIDAAYDPINNDPLAQDGTFENGVNALVTTHGDLAVAGLVQFSNGNKAVHLSMPSGRWEKYVGINGAWLKNAFEVQNATSVTFKIYTEMDGWGTYNKFNNNPINSGNVFYKNGDNLVQSTNSWINPAEKTGDYILITIDKGDYTAWATVKGDVESDFYFHMRLGVKVEGKDGFGWAFDIGELYVDDFTINK